MPNSLNVISFFHASSIREAARKPIVIPTLHGADKVPCAMDIVDKFEQIESALGERFDCTVSASGPSIRGNFHIVADRNPDVIDSLEEQKVGYGAHTVDSMADHIVENWKDDAYNVVHFRGHGHAQQDVMGMPTEQFVAGLNKASERLGRPLDTVLLESCLMANLEVLNSMGGSVATVIASQEVLNAEALPHKEMFSQALEGSMNPRDVSARMVDAAAEFGRPDTLIAVEPSKLGAVTESVASLKESIAGLPSFRKARKAVKSSLHFPRRGVETGYRRKLDLRDLGEVSAGFRSDDFSPEVRSDSERVQATLDQAVIRVARGPGYEGVSGLSVQSSSLMEKTGFKFFGLFGS